MTPSIKLWKWRHRGRWTKAHLCVGTRGYVSACGVKLPPKEDCVDAVFAWSTACRKCFPRGSA